MAGDVVFVTATDYVTVYPSQPLVPRTTKSMNDITSAALSKIHTSNTFGTILSTSSSLAPTSSTTATALFPSDQSPRSESRPKFQPLQWNDSFTILALTAVILLSVAILGAGSYTIYLYYKAKCIKCKSNEDKLKKWESGELKLVTSDIDLEKGNVEEEADPVLAARAAALATLEGQEDTAAGRVSCWDSMRSIVKGKSKDKSNESERKVVSHGTFVAKRPNARMTPNDQYFTISPIVPTQPWVDPSFQELQVPHEARVNHSRVYNPSIRPPSSMYSRPTIFDDGCYPAEVPQHSTFTNNQVPPLKNSDTLPATRYDPAQNSHNAAIGNNGQRQQRRRSRPYGGLPIPDEFEGRGNFF